MPHELRETKPQGTLSALENDDALWDAAPGATATRATEGDSPWRTPVYECHETALWRKRLVLTPYMLLDRLKVCADLAAEVREGDLPTSAVRNRVDLLADEVERLLALLWRSGLWIDTPTEQREACDGQRYDVVARPFTDGKAEGKPLPADAPQWLKEVLGVTR